MLKSFIFTFACVAIFAPVNANALQESERQLTTLCVVRELDEIEVPAKRDGVIEKMIVRRGHRVTEKQLLASLEKTDKQLRLDVANAELKQAIAKSKNEGEVDSAKAAVERAQQEAKLLNELGNEAVYLEKFRMKNNLDKAVADLKSAQNNYEQNQLSVEVKRNEAAVLVNDIKQTSVFSPVNGVIKETLKDQGEWVQQGDAILVVTRMDKLLAEGFLDSNQTSVNSVIGASAKVVFQISGEGQVVLEGLVVKHASPKLELDGKFPVWVEFDNQMITGNNGQKSWLIRPGMRASLHIDIQPSDTTDPSAVGLSSTGQNADEANQRVER